MATLEDAWKSGFKCQIPGFKMLQIMGHADTHYLRGKRGIWSHSVLSKLNLAFSWGFLCLIKVKKEKEGCELMGKF